MVSQANDAYRSEDASDPDREAEIALQEVARRSRALQSRNDARTVRIGDTGSIRAAARRFGSNDRATAQSDEPDEPPQYPTDAYFAALRVRWQRDDETDLPAIDEAIRRDEEALERAAIGYLKAGLSVLPLKRGDKKPAFAGFQTYCERLATRADVRSWRRNGHLGGLAFANGPATGPEGYSLIALDIDDQSAADRWLATNDTEGCILQHTRKGVHVYALAETRLLPDEAHLIELRDAYGRFGEFRTGRVITVAAPTLHPDATPDNPLVYRIDGEAIPKASDLKRIDDVIAFLGADVVQATIAEAKPDSSVAAYLARASEKSVAPFVSVIESAAAYARAELDAKIEALPKQHGSKKPAIEEGELRSRSCFDPAFRAWAIRETVPRRVGERHRTTFDYGRFLKATGDFAAFREKVLTDKDFCREMAREWYTPAKPFIGTKTFSATRGSFRSAVKDVHTAIDTSSVREIGKRGLEAPPPACIADYVRVDEIDLVDENVLRILHALDHHHLNNGGGYPYLGSRELGDLLGMSGPAAHKRLANLEGIEAIRCRKKGDYKSRLSSEWELLCDCHRQQREAITRGRKACARKRKSASGTR